MISSRTCNFWFNLDPLSLGKSFVPRFLSSVLNMYTPNGIIRIHFHMVMIFVYVYCFTNTLHDVLKLAMQFIYQIGTLIPLQFYMHGLLLVCLVQWFF